MPFNGSNTFTIVNSFVPGTTILSSAVNANFTDIATGLSDCVTRDCQAAVTGNLLFSSTAFLQLPNGTSVQRPGTAAAAYFRYNTTLNVPEFYNGTSWIQVSNPTSTNFFGFDTAVNLSLVASVASNILTIAVKSQDSGNDPTAGDPVSIPFRDSTIANGDPVWVQVTSALSINTNATGASLGTASSNVPFRLWVLAFNNAGTVVLALWQSVTGGASPTAIAPLNEALLQSTTGISAAATSAGTFYTPNGTTLSSKAFRIIGYVDYASGLTTAGTYASAPTTVQLFGPGVKKPGDQVQMVYSSSTSQTQVTGTTKTQTSQSASIAPTSTPNLVLITVQGNLQAGGAFGANAQLSRGATPTLIGNAVSNFTSGTPPSCSPAFLQTLDAPGTTSSTTYYVYIWDLNAAQTATWNPTGNSLGSTQVCTEIMV